MQVLDLGDIRIHWHDGGDPGGAPVVFLNSLGTDLRLWDKVAARLPPGWRTIRMDKRGHGLSDCPPGPYSMGALIRDAERVIDAAGVTGAVIVGCSIGGMIAQGLAVKRPDLARALVLSNTAAKIGTPQIWADRIATVEAEGIGALADAVMARWFAPPFRASAEAAAWRHMLTRTPAAGYAGCAAAIAGADFTATTARLTLPVLGIAGSEDGSTPPDLVRETAALVAGSRFHLIRGAGHLPCVEAPDAFAAALNGFLSALPRG